MSSLYNRLRTGTVPRLLSKYKTGTVEIGRPVNVPGANSWDPPTVTTAWIEIDAIVTGVSQKFVDGTEIVMSDREVLTQTPATFDEVAGDQLRVDGGVVSVISVMPILAAGVPVAVRFVIRG